jgi:hypothetical protein
MMVPTPFQKEHVLVADRPALPEPGTHFAQRVRL